MTNLTQHHVKTVLMTFRTSWMCSTRIRTYTEVAHQYESLILIKHKKSELENTEKLLNKTQVV